MVSAFESCNSGFPEGSDVNILSTIKEGLAVKDKLASSPPQSQFIEDLSRYELALLI
jgi:hypothetical protein